MASINELTQEDNRTEKKLKVLFVSSGNLKNFDVAPFIKVQGDSLLNENIDVTYFRVIGKGIRGYVSNIKRLKETLKNNKFDLIHAHFTLSAWVAVLCQPKVPIVLSLMGTDAYGRVEKLSQAKPSLNYLTILTLMIQPFVKRVISKSPNIEKVVWQKKKSHILPNGVNIDSFSPSKSSFRNELDLKENVQYVLFLGNPNDPRKNYDLVKKATPILKAKGIEVLAPYPIAHKKIYKYLNSVDVLVMCSLQEGSPNVVKEAMACNCKGVFTEVGDVRYLVDSTKGYRITGFDTEDLVNNIVNLLEEKECHGRSRLLELGLDLPNVAKKLKEIYLKALK
ncbi:glycosyltransferase family 4 protein [Echinicola arenosa]|nr:glycosyltransferase family 4 protein [Echinicola arenosa]